MQSIGERLEEARKKKGASLREAAEATKVRGEYLQKFEGNHFDIGLGDLYVRGFLRSYAVYLGLPADRVLSDFADLGHGEARPRQPSREVYGRMDLSIGSGEAAGEAPAPPADKAAAPPAPGQPAGAAHQSVLRRSHTGMPLQSGINQALVFKALIALTSVVVLLLVLWAVKTIMGSGSSAEPSHASAALAAGVAERAPSPTFSIVALDPVRIKVVRQSDGAELYQGPLAAGEQRTFDNAAIYLTASALESVVIEYQGKRYTTGFKGHDRVAIKPFK